MLTTLDDEYTANSSVEHHTPYARRGPRRGQLRGRRSRGSGAAAALRASAPRGARRSAAGRLPAAANERGEDADHRHAGAGEHRGAKTEQECLLQAPRHPLRRAT